jgi:hypothetical protein
MQDHIRDLLQRFQYSEQLKETAAFRILIGGEELSHVMADLGIHNSSRDSSTTQTGEASTAVFSTCKSCDKRALPLA